MTTEPVLRVPWGLSERIQTLLHPEPFRECFIFGVARLLSGDAHNKHIALLEQIIPVDIVDYEHTSSGGLVLTETASSRINNWTRQISRQGWVAVHLHSHPQGVHHFSITDDEAESQLSAWLTTQGILQFWSLVWSNHGMPFARLWDRGYVMIGKVFFGITPVNPTSNDTREALDRQRAFGLGLRQTAEQIKVGIVGVGGLGMLVVEQLARAGFKNFVLIDHDSVDVTNLNRLPSVDNRDVGRLKVRVAKRLIQKVAKSLGGLATVSTYAQDIYKSRQAQKALMHCDLVLALTDNELSRTMVLDIALNAGLEYLQAGTDIALGQNGTIQGLRAEVTGAEVGRYCPICSGRLSSGQAAIEARAYSAGEIFTHAQNSGYIREVSAPAVMGLNAVAAGMLVTEIQRRAAGIGVRDLIQIDLQSGSFITEDRLSIQHDCDVCGGVSSQ